MINIVSTFKADVYGNIFYDNRFFDICVNLDDMLSESGHSVEQNNFNHALFFKDVLTILQRYFDEVRKPDIEYIRNIFCGIVEEFDSTNTICWEIFNKEGLSWVLSDDIIGNEQLYLIPVMTYDFLSDNGFKHGSAQQGTVMFYECNGQFYTVLADNTVVQENSMADWAKYE